MTAGRPKRPAAVAVVRSSNFLFWYRDAARNGIDAKETRAIQRFLELNHAALERIDVQQLAAGQILTGGSIDRNLQGRLNRVERLCADLEPDDEPAPKAPAGITVRYTLGKRKDATNSVQSARRVTGSDRK